jgi:hypothetical protein
MFSSRRPTVNQRGEGQEKQVDKHLSQPPGEDNCNQERKAIQGQTGNLRRPSGTPVRR